MYVYRKDFDDTFKSDKLIGKLVDNNLLTIYVFDEQFYSIDYDRKMYNRLLKISKLSYSDIVKKSVYSDKIDAYLKIIK